jgi:hypothetical protein
VKLGFSGISGIFSHGLDPFKIQTRFNLDLLPNSITQYLGSFWSNWKLISLFRKESTGPSPLVQSSPAPKSSQGLPARPVNTPKHRPQELGQAEIFSPMLPISLPTSTAAAPGELPPQAPLGQLPSCATPTTAERCFTSSHRSDWPAIRCHFRLHPWTDGYPLPVGTSMRTAPTCCSSSTCHSSATNCWSPSPHRLPPRHQRPQVTSRRPVPPTHP